MENVKFSEYERLLKLSARLAGRAGALAIAVGCDKTGGDPSDANCDCKSCAALQAWEDFLDYLLEGGQVKRL